MKPVKSRPCPQWAEKIAARHPDDLSAADRIALREHLLSCPACASTYAAYTAMEAGIRNLPPVEPKRALSPELLYQQQGPKKGHSFPLVVVGFRQTTSQLRPFVAASFRQTTSQLLAYSRELQQSLPRTVRIANALGALLVVGLMVSGFIWLLAGPRFPGSGSTTGSPSRSQLKSFAISPRSKSSPTPVPSSPTLAVSPSSLTPNDCMSRLNSWTCTVTLSLASSSQGDLNWSASSDHSGVSFTPPSGTLAPGQMVQVTISVPSMSLVMVSPTRFDANTDCTPTSEEEWACVATLANSQSIHCPASFSFTGPANTVSVPWNCTTPTMNLNWSASSDRSDVTFTPSSGTLAPGQTVQVTISISNVTCPATTTFSFAGPSNTIHVPWSCSPLPTPTPSDQ